MTVKNIQYEDWRAQKMENPELRKAIEKYGIVTQEEYDYKLMRFAMLMEEVDKLADELEEYENVHYPIEKPSLLTKIKFRLGQRFAWLNW